MPEAQDGNKFAVSHPEVLLPLYYYEVVLVRIILRTARPFHAGSLPAAQISVFHLSPTSPSLRPRIHEIFLKRAHNHSSLQSAEDNLLFFGTNASGSPAALALLVLATIFFVRPGALTASATTGSCSQRSRFAKKKKKTHSYISERACLLAPCRISGIPRFAWRPACKASTASAFDTCPSGTKRTWQGDNKENKKSFFFLSFPCLTESFKTAGGFAGAAAEARIHTPRLYHFAYPVPANWTGGVSTHQGRASRHQNRFFTVLSTVVTIHRPRSVTSFTPPAVLVLFERYDTSDRQKAWLARPVH